MSDKFGLGHQASRAMRGAAGGSVGVCSCSFGENSGVDASISLRSDPAEVSAVRRFVEETMRGCGPCGHDRDRALLLVSELVTNALVHADIGVDVTVRCDGPLVTVEVHDDSEVIPAEMVVAPTVSSGRGIRIVATLADYWGVGPVPRDGKVVWFSLLSSPSLL